MAVILYLALLVFSAAGAAFLFGKYFREVKKISATQLQERLVTSSSVRLELKERWYNPAEMKFYEVVLPAFWRGSEKFVTKVRVLVLKLETRLKWLADNIRGRHINLDVGEKSEYWQNLNGAKNNHRPDKKEDTPP